MGTGLGPPGSAAPAAGPPVPRPAAREPAGTLRAVADQLFWPACLVTGLWAVFQNFGRLGMPNVLSDEPTYVYAAWRYVEDKVGPPLSVTSSSSPFDRANFQHPPLAKWFFGIAQLVAGHPSVTADRVVAAIATVLTGVVIAIWIGRAAGRWTGLLAGALTVLLPEATEDTLLRFGRYGFLDPVAGLFAAVYLLLIWEWFTSTTRRRGWLFAAASGVAIGCAAASKENGFLAAVVPVLVVLVAAGRKPQLLRQRLAQTALALFTCLVAFLLTYAPFSYPLQRIVYLIRFQIVHSGGGQLVGFDGQVSAHPPWWATLWFAAHGLGVAVTVFLLFFAAIACALRRDRLVVFCLAALAGPVIFHCFIAGVAQSFYWTPWVPPLFVLAALGVAEAARRLRAARLPAALQAGAITLALLAPLLASVSQSNRIAAVSPAGPEVLGSVLRQHGIKGWLLSSGISRYEYTYYLPDRIVLLRPPKPLNEVHAVVIGAPQCRLETDDRATRSIVAVNLAAGRLQLIHADPAMKVYDVTGNLIRPTRAQIDQQPPRNLTAGC
ncbi:MAG TPA: phospholipid carrier-dependent glycosyltransferase [Streptosporangiaceae bacterium]